MQFLKVCSVFLLLFTFSYSSVTIGSYTHNGGDRAVAVQNFKNANPNLVVFAYSLYGHPSSNIYYTNKTVSNVCLDYQYFLSHYASTPNLVIFPAPSECEPVVYDTICNDISDIEGGNEYNTFQLIIKRTKSGEPVTYSSGGSGAGGCAERGYDSECSQMNLKQNGESYSFYRAGINPSLIWGQGACFDGDFEPAPELHYTPEQLDSMRREIPSYEITNPDHPLNPNNPDAPYFDDPKIVNPDSADPIKADPTNPDGSSKDDNSGGWLEKISSQLSGLFGGVSGSVDAIGAKMDRNSDNLLKSIDQLGDTSGMGSVGGVGSVDGLSDMVSSSSGGGDTSGVRGGFGSVENSFKSAVSRYDYQLPTSTSSTALFNFPAVPALGYSGFDASLFFSKYDIGSPLSAVFMIAATIALLVLVFVFYKSLVEQFTTIFGGK